MQGFRALRNKHGVLQVCYSKTGEASLESMLVWGSEGLTEKAVDLYRNLLQKAVGSCQKTKVSWSCLFLLCASKSSFSWAPWTNRLGRSSKIGIAVFAM